MFFKLKLVPSTLWPPYLYLYREDRNGNSVKIATFDCDAAPDGVVKGIAEIVSRWPENRYEVVQKDGTLSDLVQEIKNRRAERVCKDDSCDAPHCPKCGQHTAGFLGEFEKCQSCELEQEALDNAGECARLGI